MPTGQTRSGLEVLLDDRQDLIRSRRFGLLCNQASVDRSLVGSAERLASCGEGTLAALFSPEHGLTGEAQDMEPVGGTTHDRLGVRVHSLYGSDESTLAPSRESLSDLDLLIVDLQDVGARYYTFAATMAAVMRVCGEAGIPVCVLDRPDPIGGRAVEGNLVAGRFTSFVGRFPLPARHGMTMGELARLFRASYGVSCDLTVVPLRDWSRDDWFDESGLPWVAPSPNMPTLDTASVYPGSCLIEGTNLSEGRGTTRPFEWIGAPFLDPHELARRLGRSRLPGVIFRPIRFTPSFHKWAGVSCGGVQIHVVDRLRFRPFLTGLALLEAARGLAPREFDWRREPYEFVGDRLAIDLLLGDDRLRLALESGATATEIEASFPEEQASFLPLREAVLLY